MLIRAVTSDDREAVIGLWRQVFPEYGDPNRPQRDPAISFARKLTMHDGLFWLAEREGLTIGSAMAGYDGHRGWLYSVGVLPAVRGQGIGRALVSHAEHALLALGCPKINLQVLVSRTDAQAFWGSLGYCEDEVRSMGKLLFAIP